MPNVITRSLGVLVLLLLFYFWYFLRDPERVGVEDENVILSPANGKVSRIIERDGESVDVKKKYAAIFETQTEDIWESGYLINIAMNLHNVHYQRAPLKSKLIKEEYVPGRFLNAVRDAWGLKAHFENERNELTFQTDDWFTYKIVQIAGLLARRIVDYVELDEEVDSADTIGLIKLWSQVSILLPSSVDLLIEEGQVVYDGVTQLATRK